MSKRSILIVARLFFGLLTLTAIGIQFFGVHLPHGFSAVNFFSYFTNLSNIFASLVFMVGAISLLQLREPTATDDLIRGASVAAMALVGVVYGILLRNEDLGTLLPWVNVVLHYLMPVAVLVDWFYQPPRSRLSVRQIGYWLLFPLVFVVYTLIRGAIIGFYPYRFLNPAKAGGYGGVALYGVAIFVAFLVIGWVLIAVGNGLKRSAPAQVA